MSTKMSVRWRPLYTATPILFQQASPLPRVIPIVFLTSTTLMLENGSIHAASWSHVPELLVPQDFCIAQMKE